MIGSRRSFTFGSPGALLAVGICLLSGCGAKSVLPTTSVPPRLSATQAWARPTPAGATRGVVYLRVTTDTGDAIFAASVPPKIASAASLHETMAEGGEHEKHGGPAAEMTMEAVDELPLKPGEPLVLEPGGNHIMLEGLTAELQRGQSFPLTLSLRSGRVVDTMVEVRDDPPQG